MSAQRGVRLFLDGPPTLVQLKTLREQFAPLSEVPPAELRKRLAGMAIVVVGGLSEGAERVAERLREVGLVVELFSWDDYSSDYLRSLLPQAPAGWTAAECSLEIVVRPSFTPELIVRLWSEGTAARLQVAFLNTSVYFTRFIHGARRGPASGAQVDDPEADERPTDEVVDVPAIDEPVTRALAVPPSRPNQGADGTQHAIADGTQFEIVARSGAERKVSEFHSPSPERDPDAYTLLQRVYALASARLKTDECRKRIEELREE